MSVVTFWSDEKEQTGKTLSIAAIATHMSIEHNYRILIISTAYKDENLDNCFAEPKKEKKNFGLFRTKYSSRNGRRDFRPNQNNEK